MPHEKIAGALEGVGEFFTSPLAVNIAVFSIAAVVAWKAFKNLAGTN